MNIVLLLARQKKKWKWVTLIWTKVKGWNEIRYQSCSLYCELETKNELKRPFLWTFHNVTSNYSRIRCVVIRCCCDKLNLFIGAHRRGIRWIKHSGTSEFRKMITWVYLLLTFRPSTINTGVNKFVGIYNFITSR